MFRALIFPSPHTRHQFEGASTENLPSPGVVTGDAVLEAE
jgi:hypothetical protein